VSTPLETKAPPIDASPAPFRSAFLHRAFAAFTYRDFSILWFGAFTSTVGTWMQQVAQSWLVYDLTQSSFFLGLDYFFGQLPILLFTVIGGVIADRHDRRQLILGSQYIQMANAFLLAILVLTKHIVVWEILALSFVTGVAQAFGGPAYQSLVPTLVHKKDLPNAIALNSIQFNLARVIGPVLAGIAFYKLGAAWCFALNGVSFIAVIIAILALRRGAPVPAVSEPVWRSLKTGLKAVLDTASLKGLVAMAFLGSFCSVALVTYLPFFAKDVFHGDA